jgi:hypothetical protein
VKEVFMEKKYKRAIAHLLSVLLIFGSVTTGLMAFGGADLDAYATQNQEVAPEVSAEDLVLVVWSRIALGDDGHYIRIAFDEDGTNEWDGSDAQQWCTDYYNALLEDEVGDYIVGVRTDDPEEPYAGDLSAYKACSIDGSDYEEAEPTDLDKVFFLSAYEFDMNKDYIIGEDYRGHRNLDGWLLRSAGTKEGYSLVGVISSFNRMYYAYPFQVDCSVRPAMYVNREYFGNQALAPGDQVTIADKEWTVLESPEDIQTYDDQLKESKRIANDWITGVIKAYEESGKYDAEGIAELEAIKKDALEDIADAKTPKEIINASTAALKAVVGVVTVDQAKKNALGVLEDFYNAIDKDDYDDVGKAALEDLYEQGKAAIEDAETRAEANDALDDAEDALQSVQTVDDAKEEAKKALEDYFKAKNPANYDDAGKAALNAALNNGKAAIDSQSTIAGVKAALNNAKAALDAVKTVPGAKEDAKKALDDYYRTKNPANYDDDGKAALLVALNNGKAAIDAQTTSAGITAALNNAKANLDAVTMVIVDLKKVKIKSAKAGKKSAKVTWKKVSKKNLKNTKKIEIQYSTDKTFQTNVKSKFVKAKKKSATIKGLKSKKKYYVRVRAYTKSGNVIHVSKWSKKKSVKAK